ncbi:family 20 glycosylhydrolase [Flavitalea sp. BT771]|uniref:family 20 glycosylhydrolase n=1 Tax=Flavitalea sp. BT771 TaxID=3063329 RepID=UPI0026E3493F|nr:family 20 glycosylhydrolase [Flavitalea sp. BT771]MDO6429601.1 family 20 glycosylhydrolase [Flavitalea sp. BT771]MDV6218271.1 family 20 glycosylhydrolase [Flavitalea sp. BT771]
MKHLHVYLSIVFNLFLATSTHSQQTGYKGGIIPAPQHIKVTGGDFVLNRKTILYSDSAGCMAVKLFRSYLSENCHLDNKLVKALHGSYGKDTTVVTIITKSDPLVVSEGYHLKISPRRITLTGNGAGVFYGVQTLLQLLSQQDKGACSIPCLDIDDFPRFAYRGLMLDVARHFFTVDQVRQVLDLMARYKLNTFHWHLTDDQGWRLEIKKYPKLTSVGAYNVNTVLDGDRDLPDSISTGGYYTQGQVREVIRYATERGITIIPEIEVPAHSAAALRAYPEFKCVLPAGSSNITANNIIYSPSEQTFQFLEDVLTEVAALFPGKYIHIGGDEANKKPWEESLFCQRLMKDQNLKDVHELQSYFIRRIEKILLTKGRSLVGWDEIAEGGLAQTATVMCRFGSKEESRIVKLNHKVIMTPGIEGLYFDYPQSNSGLEPFYHGPYVSSLEKTYSIDPAPESLTADEKQLVMGVQGSLWTEHVPTMNKLYYMIIPRIFGLAEVAWTLPENKNKTTFLAVSVPKHLAWLENKGYNFRVPTAFNETDTVMIGHKFILENKCLLPKAKTYYTLNGRMPTENDREFNKPLVILIPRDERRELQTVVISQTGKRSVPTRTVMYNYDPFPAVDSPGLNSGLRYYTFSSDPLDTSLSHLVTSEGVLADFRLDSLRRDLKNSTIVCHGYVNTPVDDVYCFFLPGRDDNKFFIDGRCVIADLSHFSRMVSIGSVPLKKGLHRFRLDYASDGSAVIPLYYQTSDGERHRFTPGQLFH